VRYNVLHTETETERLIASVIKHLKRATLGLKVDRYYKIICRKKIVNIFKYFYATLRYVLAPMPLLSYPKKRQNRKKIVPVSNPFYFHISSFFLKYYSQNVIRLTKRITFCLTSTLPCHIVLSLDVIAIKKRAIDALK
jgi:hypothetical protein